MPSGKPNIVQAEFYHVGGDPDASLAEVMNEVFSRISQGFRDIMAGMDPDDVKTGIKTCVRFYDESGVLTELALRARLLEALHLETLEQYQSTQGIRRWLLGRRFKRLLSEIAGMKGRQHALAVRLLASYVQAKRPIGIEKANHTFRLMRDNEAHELIESVCASYYVWLFIFENNELLANKNKGIAYAM